MVEGLRLDSQHRAFVVDDVVTTGGSLLRAVDAGAATGATVAATSALIDRGDKAESVMRERGIPYFPLLTYRDLDIPPVQDPDESRRLAPAGR